MNLLLCSILLLEILELEEQASRLVFGPEIQMLEIISTASMILPPLLGRTNQVNWDTLIYKLIQFPIDLRSVDGSRIPAGVGVGTVCVETSLLWVII